MKEEYLPSGVYIRAKCRHGRWHNSDVLDLTDESFRRLIINKLRDARLFVGLKDERSDLYFVTRCECDLKSDGD